MEAKALKHLVRVLAFVFIAALLAPAIVTADPTSTIQGVYWGNTFPGVSSGQLRPLSIDANGNLNVTYSGAQTILSPLTNIQVGNGMYRSNPIPVPDGQVGQVLTDNLLRQVVVFPTTQPVSLEPNSPIIDRSGTIISATYEQVLMPANPNRHGFLVQNQSTHNMYINDTIGYATGTSGNGDILIAAGTTYITPINQAPKGGVGIFDGFAADVFTAQEY